MISNKFLKYFLFFILFISFLAAINVNIRRHQFEEQKNIVELSMSLNDIRKAAIYSGISTETYLQNLASNTSISKIIIEERTLNDYINEGKASLLKGSEIMNTHLVFNRATLTRLYQTSKIKPNYFYILVDEKNKFETIKDFLEAEFGKDKVNQIRKYPILELLDEREDLLNLGLGIDKEDIALIKSYNFQPIFNVKNSKRLSAYLIRMKILSFFDTKKSNTILFQGNETLGYPSQLHLVKDQFLDKQINVGLYEFTNPLGFKYLKKHIPNQMFRVHHYSYDNFESTEANYIIQRYLRAARERKIDLLILRPYSFSKDTNSPLQYNLNYINELSEQLTSHGFSLSDQNQLPEKQYIPSTFWERLLILNGVIALMLIFLNWILSLSLYHSFILYFFMISLTFLLESYTSPLFINKLFALITAILFPALAIITQFPQNMVQGNFYERLFNGCFYLLKMVILCILGSLMITGLLSDISFLKGIERFSGVKLSFILPLLLIGLFFYLRPQRIKSTFFVLKRLYYSPVRTAGLVSIFSLFFIFIVMIIRTGNLIVLPRIPWELEFRQLLEQLFYVRPRTKEFLLGYPLLLISFLYIDVKISRLWIWFFNILGSIALISVVNSFCHFHSPLNISLYRTILGMILGIGITLIYLGFYKIISLFIFKQKTL